MMPLSLVFALIVDLGLEVSRCCLCLWLLPHLCLVPSTFPTPIRQDLRPGAPEAQAGDGLQHRDHRMMGREDNFAICSCACSMNMCQFCAKNREKRPKKISTVAPGPSGGACGGRPKILSAHLLGHRARGQSLDSFEHI